MYPCDVPRNTMDAPGYQAYPYWAIVYRITLTYVVTSGQRVSYPNGVAHWHTVSVLKLSNSVQINTYLYAQLFVGLFWLQITVLGYLNIEFAIQKLQYLYVDFN